MGRKWRKPHCSSPWGYIFLALGAGMVLAVIFPAGLFVILLAAILVVIGILLLK